MEYTATSSADDSFERPANVRIATAMEDCRICILRKRESSDDGMLRMSTSIWALSEDGNARMQQSRTHSRPPTLSINGYANTTTSR